MFIGQGGCMKFPIFSLLILMLAISCNPQRQQEQASYNDFFMSRSDQAKSIKEQNYSTTPERFSPQQQEQSPTDDDVIEAIIPEAQEEAPAAEPSVNGATETEYLKEQQNEPDYHLNSEDDYFEEIEKEEELSEEQLVTPEEVRGWRY